MTVQCKLQEVTDFNWHICIKIPKGMFTLPQSGVLANKLSMKRLAKHGCHMTNAPIKGDLLHSHAFGINRLPQEN